MVAIGGYFFSRILGNWCVRNGSEKALCNTATLGFLNEIIFGQEGVLLNVKADIEPDLVPFN